MVKKATLVPIEIIDGQIFVSKLLMHETKVLEVTIWSHTNKMIFNVISSLSQPHFGLSVRVKPTFPKVGTWSVDV